MKVNRIYPFFLMLILMNCCFFDQSVKTQYFDPQYKIGTSENILILPSFVVKEIKTGSDVLESMFDTFIFSYLKEKGYQIQSAESIYPLIKERNIGMSELKKIEFKEIDSKILLEIASKLNVKYFVRLTVFSHIKEDLMTEGNYFLTLKAYNVEGKEILFLSSHYQGEETIGSAKILKLVENLAAMFVKGK